MNGLNVEVLNTDSLTAYQKALDTFYADVIEAQGDNTGITVDNLKKTISDLLEKLKGN